MMEVIGLTGQIASGKSTVSAYLRQKGFAVVDADEIAHEVIRRGGRAYAAVVRQFGTEFVGAEGEIDRRNLGQAVFADPEKLAQMADANGRPAEPLRKAAAGILVCGDLDRAFRFAKDYWVIDGAIAAQNICLAAQELGLGAVWLGTWPQMDRVEAQKKLFALPETIVPHSIIALGYPEADITAPRASRYEANRVHFEQW